MALTKKNPLGQSAAIFIYFGENLSSVSITSKQLEQVLKDSFP
jgi:hypothetical protein